jgi:hypothetical protein
MPSPFYYHKDFHNGNYRCFRQRGGEREAGQPPAQVGKAQPEPGLPPRPRL